MSLPFGRLPSELQDIDPERQIGGRRSRPDTEPAPVLGKLGILAPPLENFGKHLACLVGVLPLPIRSTGRLLDENACGSRIRLDEVPTQHNVTTGKIAKNVSVIEDCANPAILHENTVECCCQ